MLVYLDGSYLAHTEARVSAFDRGFMFGDGVYEVWRVRDGRLCYGEMHEERLREGLDALAITKPAEAQAGAVTEIAARLLEESGLMQGDASVYVQITRGAAPRTHFFPPHGTWPTVFAYANRIPDISEARAAGVSAITVPDQRWHRCNIKTLQLLPNVLAKQAARTAGAYDAIFVRDGVVTEGSHTNIFAVVRGELRTHPLGPHVLPGVTRSVVCDLASTLGIAMHDRAISAEELMDADELFFTGTTTDILPIVRVDGRPIGCGHPGSCTRRLYDAYAHTLSR